MWIQLPTWTKHLALLTNFNRSKGTYTPKFTVYGLLLMYRLAWSSAQTTLCSSCSLIQLRHNDYLETQQNKSWTIKYKELSESHTDKLPVVAANERYHHNNYPLHIRRIPVESMGYQWLQGIQNLYDHFIGSYPCFICMKFLQQVTGRQLTSYVYKLSLLTLDRAYSAAS